VHSPAVGVNAQARGTPALAEFRTWPGENFVVGWVGCGIFFRKCPVNYFNQVPVEKKSKPAEKNPSKPG
jgi:hypothetical protein